jgi:arylsulfatase
MGDATPSKTILLVVVDQLAARWLEEGLGGIVPLPNLGWMRESGVMFTRAFTNNPVCSPARATIATGLHSVNHGVTECGYDLDPAVPTFMQALQSSGWRTGAFGKLHFLPQIAWITPDYRPYGFDVTHITEDSRVGEWLDWVRDTHPEHYQAAQATVWMTMIPGLDEYGEGDVDLRAQILEAQEVFPQTKEEAYELPFPAEVSQSAWITDRALDFIRGSSESSDLFAQVSYVQPHNPFTPPSEYVPLVNCDLIRDPEPAEWASEPIPYYQQERYADPSYAGVDWKRQRQLYFADIAHLDNELGRLRAGLEETGRADNTLIVFTSDHGELLHDHGLLGKWERHYDACIRVPLMVTGPGVAAGDNGDLVDHTDIAPTIYEWAGVEKPTLPRWPESAEPLPMLPGTSLVNRTSGTRDAVYVQSNNNHWEATPRSWARTIRTERHRYTRHLASGGEQLFDLVADPGEQVNLAHDPAFADVAEELRDRLMELVSREGYPNSPRQIFRIGSW